MSQIFVLELTLEEIHLAAAGLAEMPYRIAAPLMAKVQAQVEAQSRVPAPPSMPQPLAVVDGDGPPQGAPKPQRRSVQSEPDPVERPRRQARGALLGNASVSALNAGSLAAELDVDEVVRSFAEQR